jgi:hypothetical protein
MADNFNLTGEEFALKDDLAFVETLKLVPGLSETANQLIIEAVDSLFQLTNMWYSQSSPANRPAAVKLGVVFSGLPGQLKLGIVGFDSNSVTDYDSTITSLSFVNTAFDSGGSIFETLAELYYIKYPHHNPNISDAELTTIIGKLKTDFTIYESGEKVEDIPTQQEDPEEGDEDIENPLPLPPDSNVDIPDSEDNITHAAWRQPVNENPPPKTFFYSKPKKSSGNRIGKLIKGTALSAMEQNMGPGARWHKVKVLSSNLTPDLKNRVGYVIAAHTRPLQPSIEKTAASFTPPAVVIEKPDDLRNGVDKSTSIASWKTRDDRPVLERDSEEPSSSTYSITVSNGIQNIALPADGFSDEEKQFVFEEARIDGIVSMLKYYNKDPFLDVEITEDIETINDAYKELATKLNQVSWVEDYYISTNTSNGSMKVLVMMAARHFDSIPQRVETFDFDKASQATAYPLTLKYGMLKNALSVMITEVLPHYDKELRGSGMKVVFDSINSGPLFLNREAELLEQWFADLNEYLFVNDFDYKKNPEHSRDGVIPSPAQPHDDDIIEIGFASDYRILYILFNGQPLRTSFNWAVGTKEFPGETVLAERRTNQFVLGAYGTSEDFESVPDDKRTPWTEWVRKKVYIYPKIRPGSADDGSAEIKRKIEEANAKPIKTLQELEEETSFFDQFETKRLLATEAEVSYTDTYDAVVADIDKISKKINDLETAYFLLANKYGMEPLIDAIMYCLMQKIPSLEELIYKLGLSHIYKDIKQFIAFIEKIVTCVPWELLLAILEESLELVYEKYDEPSELTDLSQPEPGEIVETVDTNPPPAPEPKPVVGNIDTVYIKEGDDNGLTIDDANPEGKVSTWQQFLTSGTTFKFMDPDPEDGTKTKEYNIPILTLAGIKKMPASLPWADNLFINPDATAMLDSGKFVDGVYGPITFTATQTLQANLSGIAGMNENLKLAQIFRTDGQVSESGYLYAKEFLSANQTQTAPDGKVIVKEKVTAGINGVKETATRTELAILHAARPPKDFFVAGKPATPADELYAEYVAILQEAEGKDAATALKASKEAQLVLSKYVQAMGARESAPVIGEGVSFIGQEEQSPADQKLEQAAAVAIAQPGASEGDEPSCDQLRAELDELLNKIVIAGYIEDIDDWPGDDWLGLGGESMEDWQKRLDLRSQWTACVNKKIDKKLHEISNPPQLPDKRIDPETAEGQAERERIRTEHTVFAMPKTVRQLAVYLDASGEIPEEFSLSLKVRPGADVWGMLKTQYMLPEGGVFATVDDDTMACIADILADLLPREVIDVIINILAAAGLLKRFGIMTNNFEFLKTYDPEPDFMGMAEEILIAAIEETIVSVIKELTKMVKDACAEEARPDFGAASLSDAFGKDNPSTSPDDFELLQARLRALQETLDDWNLPYKALPDLEAFEQTDVPDFFSIADDIAKLLTPSQFCSILQGNPSFVVKTAVLEFIKELYPDFYDFFTTDANLMEFLAQVGSHVDPSFCFEFPDTEPDFKIDSETNLCNLDVVEDEKQALMEKGLSEDQANEMVNKNVLDRINTIDKLNQLKNPEPPDFCGLTQDLKVNQPSLQRQLRKTVKGMIDNIRIMFGGDLGIYTPLIIKSGKLSTTADLENLPDLDQAQTLIDNLGLEGGGKCDFSAFASFLKDAVDSGKDDPTADTAKALAGGQPDVKDGNLVARPDADIGGILGDLKIAQTKHTLVATDLRSALSSDVNVSVVRNGSDLANYSSGIEFLYPDPRSNALPDKTYNSQKLFTYIPELTGKSQQLDEWSFEFQIGNSQLLLKNSKPVANLNVNNWVYNNLDFTKLSVSKVQDLFSQYVMSKGTCNLQDQFGSIEDPLLEKLLKTETYEDIMQNMFSKLTSKILDSELFFADEFTKLKLSPELDEVLEKCKGASPSSLDDAGALDLLRTEELIEECINRFNDEAAAGCSLIAEDGEDGPLSKILAQAAMLLMVRTFIIEHTLLTVFAISAFGKASLDEEITTSVVFAFLREFCKENRAFALIKESAEDYTSWLKNNEIPVSASGGEESLKWIIGREIKIILEDFQKILGTSLSTASIADYNTNSSKVFWETFVEPELIGLPVYNASDDPMSNNPSSWTVPSVPKLIGGATYYEGEPVLATTKKRAAEITNNNFPVWVGEDAALGYDGNIIDPEEPGDDWWYHTKDELRMATYLSRYDKSLGEAAKENGVFILEPYIRVNDRYHLDAQGGSVELGLEKYLKEAMDVDFTRPSCFKSHPAPQGVGLNTLNKGTYMNLDAWQQICRQVTDDIYHRHPILAGYDFYDESAFPFKPISFSQFPSEFIETGKMLNIHEGDVDRLDKYLAENHPSIYPPSGDFPVDYNKNVLHPPPYNTDGTKWQDYNFGPGTQTMKYAAAMPSNYDYKYTSGMLDPLWVELHDAIEAVSPVIKENYMTTDDLSHIMMQTAGVIPIWWAKSSKLPGATNFESKANIGKTTKDSNLTSAPTLLDHYEMYMLLKPVLQVILAKRKKIAEQAIKLGVNVQTAEAVLSMSWQDLLSYQWPETPASLTPYELAKYVLTPEPASPTPGLEEGDFMDKTSTWGTWHAKYKELWKIDMSSVGKTKSEAVAGMHSIYPLKNRKEFLYKYSLYLKRNYISLRTAIESEYTTQNFFEKQAWEDTGAQQAVDAKNAEIEAVLEDEHVVAAKNFLAADHNATFYYGEGGDIEEDFTMFNEPWKIGLRLSYVIPTDEKASDTTFKVLKDRLGLLSEQRKELFGGTYQNAPGLNLYREFNDDGNGVKEYYVIPIAEEELSIAHSVEPWSFGWVGKDLNMTLQDYFIMGEDFTGASYPGKPDAKFWQEALKDKIYSSIEFQTFREYIFPVDRFISMSSLYTTFATRKIKHMDNLLSSTKKGILSVFNLAKGGGGYEYQSPVAGKFDQATDPARFNLGDYNLAGIILKMIIKTPFLILKGVTESSDPNIMAAKKIIETLELMLGFYKAIGGCQEQIDQIQEILDSVPFPLLSIGLLPSALPFGVGFPPPPIGIGIGPPMTALAPAYLAMGLWDNTLMNSLDKIFDKQQSDKEAARKAAVEEDPECAEKIIDLLYISDEQSED